MPHQHSELIEIRLSKGKGRGVFAKHSIDRGAVIERVPLLFVTWKQVEDSELAHYVFDWNTRKAVLALGYGSLYNHSFQPNARYDDVGRHTKEFTALRNIAAGEEITINYNGDPADRTNELDFSIVE